MSVIVCVSVIEGYDNDFTVLHDLCHLPFLNGEKSFDMNPLDFFYSLV